MKKNNVFKVLFLTFFVIVLLSCFIKTATVDGTSAVINDVDSIGLAGFPQILYNSIINNIGAFIFVLSVGAMYGVLNKTGAYQELIVGISNKFKNKEKVLLIVSIIFLSLISSLFGLQIEIFIFIPFITALLMHVGYDKKTVFASTFGSILIGMLGATFNTSILYGINSYYSVSFNSQIIVKAFILVIVLFLYVTHVLKKSTISYENIDYSNIPNYEVSNVKNKSKFPVTLYIIVMFLLVVVGVFRFGNIIGFDVFSDVSKSLSYIDFFKNIFGSIPVFTKFSYVDLSYLIFLSTLIIGFIYSVKLDEILDGIYKGIKGVILSGFVLLIALTIPEICFNHSFYITIVNEILSHFNNFNIFISSVVVFITSVFVPNISGVVNILPLVNATVVSDINVMTLISQTIFGLAMLIAPTSALLMFGLTYEKVGYFEWLIYIFKVFMYILIILLALFLIIVLL